MKKKSRRFNKKLFQDIKQKILNIRYKCLAPGYFNLAEINLMSMSGELYDGRLRFNQNRSFKEFRFFLVA